MKHTGVLTAESKRLLLHNHCFSMCVRVCVCDFCHEVQALFCLCNEETCRMASVLNLFVFPCVRLTARVSSLCSHTRHLYLLYKLHGFLFFFVFNFVSF